MQPSYSIQQTAKFCETTIWTIYNRLKDKSIRGYRVAGGRNFRISGEEIVRFMNANQIPLPPELQPQKTKILIVDDDSRILSSLVRHFKRMPGFEVETASSGFRAGLLIQSFHPDFVILDIMLGDLDGREVIKTIRGNPKYENMKIIVISGYIREEEVQQLLKSGFDDYLAKPFRLSKLMQKIERFLPPESRR